MLTNTRDQHEVLVDVEDINTLKKKHEREENKWVQCEWETNI